MSVGEMVSFLETMELSERQKLIGEQVLKEIKARIGFLNDVGLDYLTYQGLLEHYLVEKRSESVWQHRSVLD